MLRRLGKIMVEATMAVYKDSMDVFLPTPSKSHYIFNLRDFARVVSGVLLAPSTHMQAGLTTTWKFLVLFTFISHLHVFYVCVCVYYINCRMGTNLSACGSTRSTASSTTD